MCTYTHTAANLPCRTALPAAHYSVSPRPRPAIPLFAAAPATLDPEPPFSISTTKARGASSFRRNPQTTRAAARRRRPPPYRTLRRGQAPDNCRRRSLRSRYSHELTHGVRSLFVNKTSRRLRVTGVSMPDAPLTERTKRGVTATPSFANAPIRRRNASGLTRSVDCPIPDQASSQLSSSCVRQSCPLRL